MYLKKLGVVPHSEYQSATRLIPRIWGQYQGKPCIHTYINPQTQSGYRAITQSYRVQKYHMGSDYKYIQSSLINLSMGDIQNELVIVNPK